MVAAVQVSRPAAIGADRVELEDVDAGRTEPIEEFGFGGERSPTIIDEVDGNTTGTGSYEVVGELASRDVVELVRLHVDADTSLRNGRPHGTERLGAVQEQGDAIARKERTAGVDLPLTADKGDAVAGSRCKLSGNHLSAKPWRVWSGRACRKQKRQKPSQQLSLNTQADDAGHSRRKIAEKHEQRMFG